MAQNEEGRVNDMRLGDLDALFRAIKNSDWLPHERINAMKMVREQPTVDAVEVVRCKDCEYRDTGYCAFDCFDYEATDDSFCSYGKRKVGE